MSLPIIPSFNARAALMASAAIGSLCLAGCAGIGLTPPRVGDSATALVSRAGEPTARHTLEGGLTRLEYATGPMGRETWMVDVDAGGRIAAARQVLELGYLSELQGRLPGMTRAQLLQQLGSPGERRAGGRMGGELWSWRYETNECQWFQVGLQDDGRVSSGSFGIDPLCSTAGDRD